MENVNNEQYNRSYLEVLLMICAFETYGKECINYFELNPTLFLSTSGLQRFGDVDLKLISYIEVSILWKHN